MEPEDTKLLKHLVTKVQIMQQTLDEVLHSVKAIKKLHVSSPRKVSFKEVTDEDFIVIENESATV